MGFLFYAFVAGDVPVTAATKFVLRAPEAQVGSKAFTTTAGAVTLS
ncbi:MULTISPECIES: hypothetical protein [unclassified Bradyrhizobium]|nr:MULTISPECIES: hypothetical protein [unclassified Bradyrhizobium]WGS21099.1 hypothetical protein MTX22_04850 [Bradyrhizobium sp. ISRA463]WGS28017.1 hypothetical protein MTX19_02700 [Bradyrhizobium sp. ISRA464]